MRLLPWLLLCGCASQPVAKQSPLQTGVRDKYLFHTPDMARLIEVPAPARRAAVLPSTQWRDVELQWSDPCDMNRPWIPSRSIYSGPSPMNLTWRTNVANPWPMREWMSNGVYHSEFVPVTNSVRFPGQQAEFFQVR